MHDMGDIGRLQIEQRTTKGVPGYHVSPGIYLFRPNSSTGSTGAVFGENASGINYAEVGANDRGEIGNRLMEILLSLMEFDTSPVETHKIFDAPADTGPVMIFKDGNIDQHIVLQGCP